MCTFCVCVCVRVREPATTFDVRLCPFDCHMCTFCVCVCVCVRACVRLRVRVSRMRAEANAKVFVCRCGQSKKFPICDGSHHAVNRATNTRVEPFLLTKETNNGKDKVFV
jgi:CDGSH-type Zn-finger protein